MTKKISILLSTFIVLAFFLSLFVLAIPVNAQMRETDIVFEIVPKYPRANEEVRASVATRATDLNKAKISWILNGETIKETIGQKDFSFRVGNTNSQTTVEVKIETLDGSVANKRITISPADIDLLWEAQDSYVPPFYRGKAMIPSQGKIKIVALPNSSENKGLIYSWKKDGVTKLNSSGFGKNSYTFQNSYLEDSNTIETTVSSISGENIGSGKITVAPRNPKILFYKKDVSLGTLWKKTLNNNFNINSNGDTLVVEPYFFSPKNLNSSELSLKWMIGDTIANTSDIKNELSIKPEKGQSGSAKIKVLIDNTNRLFLSAEKELNVNF